MTLFPILSKRACLNILKCLHETEFVEKTAHSMNLSAMDLPFENQKEAVDILFSKQLITKEEQEADTVLSLTEKGKTFFEHFDQLNGILDGTAVKEEPKAYQIEYSLTELEQKILILCYKIRNETGMLVPLKFLTQEVYPRDEPTKKSATVSRYVKKLEELNLMFRVKKNNKTFFDVTDSGERTIKEQLADNALI